jgi:hypothetical protein
MRDECCPLGAMADQIGGQITVLQVTMLQGFGDTN